MAHVPIHRTDMYVRVSQPRKAAEGEDGSGDTVRLSYPVVGYNDTDGTPLIALASPAPGSTTRNGRVVPASDFTGYELYMHAPELANRIVEVIPGSGEELIYKLPTGETSRGVIPLWGRRTDGSLVPVLTAETVPHIRTIERDGSGEIVGVIEE